MKILHALNHFLPQQTAGTEVYAWALSKQQQHNGHEVEITIPHYGVAVSSHYDYDGLKVFQFAEPSTVDRSLIMGFRKPEGLQAFEKYLEERKPDIVHFHELAGSNGITIHHVKAAKNMGAKVVMTFHLAGYTCKTGTLVYKEKELCHGRINIDRCSACHLHGRANSVVGPMLEFVSKHLYKAGIDTTKWDNKMGTALGTGFVIDKLKKHFQSLVSQCDKVIVLTQWYKEMLLLNGVPKEKIVYIPQGLAFSVIEKVLHKVIKSSIPLRLVFIGRIGRLKGLHLLLEAVLGLPEDKISLHIYGQPCDADYEKDLRHKSGSHSNIQWKGKVLQENVLPVLREYDILCLPSTFSEMSPLVIQEAFAAGLPVLASDVYGNAEQIKHNKNGWLFEFKNTESLKTQLQKLMNNTMLIEVAKKNIKAVRTFDVIAKEQLKVYQKLLQEL